MEAALFQPDRLDLRKRFLDIHIEDRLSYDPDTNTVFMDYAGMRVRTEEDLHNIKEAVDNLLEPLGKRVNSIVNYERFEADPEITPKYLDLVKYVEDKYYIRVSRYTTSGFMRLKLAQELDKRHVTSEVYETHKQARNHLSAKKI
jgi:propionate CoA-transferase